MTILQNAYKGYLTNKYEKEINEFKELAFTVIDNAELKLKETLYESAVILNRQEHSKRVSIDLLHLIKIKKLINSNPLEIESRLFNKEYIDVLVNEYQKLNNLIVKGESNFIVFKPVEPISLNGLEQEENVVSDYIDKIFEEARKIIDERLNEIGNQKCHINITINDCNTSASKFATEIMNNLKKYKCSLY